MCNKVIELVCNQYLEILSQYQYLGNFGNYLPLSTGTTVGCPLEWAVRAFVLDMRPSDWHVRPPASVAVKKVLLKLHPYKVRQTCVAPCCPLSLSKRSSKQLCPTPRWTVHLLSVSKVIQGTVRSKFPNSSQNGSSHGMLIVPSIAINSNKKPSSWQGHREFTRLG